MSERCPTVVFNLAISPLSAATWSRTSRSSSRTSRSSDIDHQIRYTDLGSGGPALQKFTHPYQRLHTLGLGCNFNVSNWDHNDTAFQVIT